MDTNLFLRIQVLQHNKNELRLSQEHYALEKLQSHDLDKAKSVKYPIDKMHEPFDGKCTKHDYALFNKIIGELQYLANCTRPDISHAVNHLARFL